MPMLSFTPWDRAAGPPPLGGDFLHLWRIQVGASGADPDACWPILSPAERNRAQRLATGLLRDRYIRAHGGLRLVLSLYMRRRPYDIVFSLSKTGKPSIVEPCPGLPQRIQFNLTGSQDLALVAVSVDHPIGVDCELIRPGRDFLGIARRMFPPRVVDTLEGMPLESRPEVFYAAWTALEAEVKADGRGLFRAPEPSALPLTTAHCMPQPGYLAAVARHKLPPARSWQGFEWLPPL